MASDSHQSCCADHPFVPCWTLSRALLQERNCWLIPLGQIPWVPVERLHSLLFSLRVDGGPRWTDRISLLCFPHDWVKQSTNLPVTLTCISLVTVHVEQLQFHTESLGSSSQNWPHLCVISFLLVECSLYIKDINPFYLITHKIDFLNCCCLFNLAYGVFWSHTEMFLMASKISIFSFLFCRIHAFLRGFSEFQTFKNINLYFPFISSCFSHPNM